jgi:TPP-dependent indolepyruvate ferredoxin oxidoreductase alpha subunit
MMELRIRACHVREFFSRRRISLRGFDPPPARRPAQGIHLRPPGASAGDFPAGEAEERRAAARSREFIWKTSLNEIFDGKEKVGLIVQGGLYNGLQRSSA